MWRNHPKLSFRGIQPVQKRLVSRQAERSRRPTCSVLLEQAGPKEEKRTQRRKEHAEIFYAILRGFAPLRESFAFSQWLHL
jgi:hypothetical protein